MTTIAPIHPGEISMEAFLEPCRSARTGSPSRSAIPAPDQRDRPGATRSGRLVACERALIFARRLRGVRASGPKCGTTIWIIRYG